MSEPKERRVLKSENKENVPPQSVASHSELEESNDEFPFIGLPYGSSGLRLSAGQKQSGERRRSHQREVLRDATAEYVNVDVTSGRGGKEWIDDAFKNTPAKVRFENAEKRSSGGENRAFCDRYMENEREEQVSDRDSESNQDIDSEDLQEYEEEDDEEYDESIASLLDLEHHETTIQEEDPISSSEEASNSDSDPEVPFLRIDNVLLRSKLHPPQTATLRRHHLMDISRQKEWSAKKACLVKKHPEDVFLDPISHRRYNPPQPYKRPRTRRQTIAHPAIQLFKHLGLLNKNTQTPPNSTAARVHRWLTGEDETLRSRVSLVPPRMYYAHVSDAYNKVYVPARQHVLPHLKIQYPTAEWCMLFSEFVFFDERYDGNNQGCCLFLLLDDGPNVNVRELTKKIEWIVGCMKSREDLAVIVRTGKVGWHGSYGLSRDESYTDEEGEHEVEDADRMVQPRNEQTNLRGWLNPFSRRNRTNAAPVVEGKLKEEEEPSKPSKEVSRGKVRRNKSWSPSPTPDFGELFEGWHEVNTKGIPYKELIDFNYGLRWVTNKDIPSTEEGLNSTYQMRPNLGGSIGPKRGYSSGTLSGYLTDPKGEVYAMTCHHVMAFDSKRSSYSYKTNELKGHKVAAPGCGDIRLEAMAKAHEIDGLIHETGRAIYQGHKALAERLWAAGNKKLERHDHLVAQCDRGGANFGKVIGSGWRIIHSNSGPHLVDQVLIKPQPERVGTNTFTYTGADNRTGKRYRLEARGWTDLQIGDEVVKIGRTTGMTKGTVVSLQADVRLCMGDIGGDAEHDWTGVSRFWDIRPAVVTSGAGPWFSQNGDSGAWILKFPKFEDMLKWDLRRSGSARVHDPIAAPVGGMLFAGADSVDGISLSFYNPSVLMREHLGMFVEGGEELTPGFGKELSEPDKLCPELENAERWSRQHQKAMAGFEDYVEDQYWDHQLQRYSERHMFRDEDCLHGIEQRQQAALRARKGKSLKKPDSSPVIDEKRSNDSRGFRKGKSASRKPADEFPSYVDELAAATVGHGTARTPRRGTLEKAPNMPYPPQSDISELSTRLRQSKLLAAVEPPVKSRSPSKKLPPTRMTSQTASSSRMQPKYTLISPRGRVRRAVPKINDECDSSDNSE
ncbi:hypothetical protein H072_2547 [Dactylellina haptotyla CBS 200.50]|uniref:Uncharacterized protein n=1 Tax=Dactylellina haptotyla (strain CBS 200.50) TaxID=1284197 RepID=S8BVI0_DACHA|nr:hypothetical protein H072_2547 [Dactylellina haptotyla CBS 200.50]